MTELEDYQDYIQRSHNAFCKIVIRHAAIDIALRLRKQWEKELSLEYLMFEKFVPFSTTDEYFKEPEPCEEYPFTVCGQTVRGCRRQRAPGVECQRDHPGRPKAASDPGRFQRLDLERPGPPPSSGPPVQ